MIRILKSFFQLCAVGLLLGFSVRAETFQLSDGRTLNGEVIGVEDGGVRLRLDDGTYPERISWGRFSPADLLKLQKNPKAEPFVAPFLESADEPRPQAPAAPEIKQPERLSRPASRSVLGSLFQSPLGWFLILLMYGANIYAGFEVAVFRARPRALVCGVSALLPVIGPIIYLSLPTCLAVSEAEEGGVTAAAPEDALVVNPMQSEVPASQPSSLHLHSEPTAADKPAAEAPPEVFARGPFTFNRRFFETRFPKFFGVHHGTDRDKVLVLKAGRHEYVTERIVRVTAAEVVVEVGHGAALNEVTVPYQDIMEVVLQPKT